MVASSGAGLELLLGTFKRFSYGWWCLVELAGDAVRVDGR